MKSIVYLGAAEGYEAARPLLAQVGEPVHLPAEPEAVAAALPGAAAVLDASMKVRFTDPMIRSAPGLRIISTATTGSDHIERGAALAQRVDVRTLKEDGELLRNITPAAELSWALLMACARRLVPAVAHVRAGNWVREDFPGTMLNGRTLGVVGCGRIGQWMARYARAFDMRVVGYDPVIAPWPAEIERASLEEVAERADFLSVHVHLSESTRGLISADVFRRMKPGGVFINTARGAVADEAALLAALERGHLAGAGLDVLEGEPEIDDHPLVAYARTHDNLLITPHCGGFSPDAVRRVCVRAAEKIVEALKSPA